MALIRYKTNPPPVVATRAWIYAELRKIETTNVAIVDLLEALEGVPIQIGAPNSGGAGFRALIIPN